MNNRPLLPSNQQHNTSPIESNYPSPQHVHHNQHQQHLGTTSYPYHNDIGELQSNPRTIDTSGNASNDRGTFDSSPVTPSATASQKPTYAKRGKITIVACVPCRRRKTKCDGQRPACGQCASRDHHCLYDMTDDQRKLTHLRENVEQLQDKSNSLEGLLHTIQGSNEEEASEVYKRLRSGQNLHSIAEHVQASHVLSGVGTGARGKRPGFDIGSTSISEYVQQSGRHLDFERLVRAISLSDEAGAEEIVRRLKQRHEISAILHSVDQRTMPSPSLVRKAIPSSLECNFARGDQTFGMIKNVDNRSHYASRSGQASEFNEYRQKTPWTYVTEDSELIEHLVELYFTWQHSFFQSFPEKLFKSDMRSGRTKYCSPVLVSIICACGAFLSSRQSVVEANGGGKRLLDQFYEEATEHLRRDETASLTNTAALSLIGYVEGTKGRLSALWMTGGRGSLMALDINLHLRKNNITIADTQGVQELKNESLARAHAFWGSFHADTTTGFTLGRLPRYNINGMTVDLPVVDSREDEETWKPYGTEGPDYPFRPGVRSSTFHYTATLSEIINTTLLMFFAPTVSLSGTILVEHYEKYLRWKQSLPETLKNPYGAPPHVISLHMYYHTAVLLLFRPFLKARIINSPKILPRDVCRQSANEISNLFSNHVEMFGYNGLWMFQVHCLLTACTIHIINIPTIAATTRLTAACDSLQKLTDRNQWASSSLKILRGLVEKWNLILPQEADEALYRDVSPKTREIDISRPQPLSRSASWRGDARQGFAVPTDLGTAHMNDQPQWRSQPQESEMPDFDHEQNSSVPHNYTHDQHNSTKRPSSRPQSLSEQNTHFPHDPSFTSRVVPKRQRTMATEYPIPADLGGGSSSATAGQTQQNVSRTKQHGVTSYLYSPLVDQPAPFLVPVRSQRRDQGQMARGESGADGNNVDSNSTSPYLNNSSPKVPQEHLKQHQHPATHATMLAKAAPTTAATEHREVKDNPDPNPKSQSSSTTLPSSHHHQHHHHQTRPQANDTVIQATQDSNASELAPMEFGDFPDRVEGLRFDDDWRDPFMGFLEFGGAASSGVGGG